MHRRVHDPDQPCKEADGLNMQHPRPLFQVERTRTGKKILRSSFEALFVASVGCAPGRLKPLWGKTEGGHNKNRCLVWKDFIDPMHKWSLHFWVDDIDLVAWVGLVGLAICSFRFAGIGLP